MSKNNYDNGFTGFDTETIHGNAVICSTHKRAWIAHDFRSCVAPLFIDYGEGLISSRLFLYNMDYDVRAIFKYLTLEELENIMFNHDADDYEDIIIDGQFKIFYIPSKFMSITNIDSHKTLNFYDLAQFFNYEHLDDLAKKYFDDQKIKNGVTEVVNRRKQLGFNDDRLNWFFAHHLESIKEYCIHDSYLTRKLAIYLSDKVKEEFGIRLTSFASKAGIAQQLIQNATKTKIKNKKTGKEVIKSLFPKFLPDNMEGKFADEAYRGGMFDCFQRGSFGKCTNFDISSAYPAAMQRMPHWYNGYFAEITQESDIKDDDFYGWVLCEFDSHWIPYRTSQNYTWQETLDNNEVEYRASNNNLIYPTGHRWQIITLLEYRFLKEYNELITYGGGYVWRDEGRDLPNPFNWVQKQYDRKNEIKKAGGAKTYEYSLIKIALNGGYGKTAQRTGVHRLQNFFYASYITAECRIQVARFIKEHDLENKVILIATDGILIEGYYKFDNLGEGLGSWDEDRYESAFVLGNGVYQLNTKDYSKVATRGFYLPRNFKFIDYLEQVKDESWVYVPSKPRPLTIGRCLKWKKLTKEDINVFRQIDKKISIETDKSKIWSKDIKTFGDLLNGVFKGKRYNLQTMDAILIPEGMEEFVGRKKRKTLDAYN